MRIRAFAVAIALAGALALALPALASSTFTCWVGPDTDCGGDVGPTNGAMFQQGHEITFFGDALKCLGSFTEHFDTGPYKENYEVSVNKNFPLSHAGTFSYNGPASRTAKRGHHTVTIHLTGKIVSKHKATVTLKVDYGSCGTLKITMHPG
jgi:hypothetical protein